MDNSLNSYAWQFYNCRSCVEGQDVINPSVSVLLLYGNILFAGRLEVRKDTETGLTSGNQSTPRDELLQCSPSGDFSISIPSAEKRLDYDLCDCQRYHKHPSKDITILYNVYTNQYHDTHTHTHRAFPTISITSYTLVSIFCKHYHILQMLHQDNVNLLANKWVFRKVLTINIIYLYFSTKLKAIPRFLLLLVVVKWLSTCMTFVYSLLEIMASLLVKIIYWRGIK